MKVVLLLAAALAVAHAGLIAAPLAPTFLRTPSLDSAFIHTNRLGANFVYSTAAGHAYAPLNPIVYTSPVATAYGYSLALPPSVVPVNHPVLGHPLFPFIPGVIPLGDPKNATAPAEPEKPAEGAAEETTPEPSDESAGEANKDGADESQPAEPQADDSVSVESA